MHRWHHDEDQHNLKFLFQIIGKIFGSKLKMKQNDFFFSFFRGIMGSQLYQSSDIEYNSKAHIKLFPWEDLGRPSEQNKAWMSQQEKCN